MVSVAVGFAVGAFAAMSMIPGNAASGPEHAAIDIASSASILSREARGVLPLSFSVVCSRPSGSEPCQTATTLFFRPQGGVWSETSNEQSGTEISFAVALPSAGYLEYFLEVSDKVTETVVLFPDGGAKDPLRVYVLPDIRPQLLEETRAGRDPDSILSMPWGTELGEAGLIRGSEGSTIGPQAVDVDENGDVYLLDSANSRIQVLDGSGQLTDSIPLQIGPLGDMVLGDDGSLYVLDAIPRGPDPQATIHMVVPEVTPFSAPRDVVSLPAPEWGTTLLNFADGVLWGYGMPSDAWHPIAGKTEGLPHIRMGMPTAAGEVLRRIHDLTELDVASLSNSRTDARLLAPAGWFFGELALVQPDGSGGLWVVVRTWREEPNWQDQHDVIHISEDGDVIRHFAVENSEYAETGSLSQFRLGGDGRLYQIWTDEGGMQIRGFDLTREANGGAM